MTWQAFGSLAAGNQPLSLFDTLSGQIAQTVVVPTTAAGTNAITLSINANGPAISAYNNFQQFSFVAANNSTGAVTVQVGVLAALNLYKPGNIAAGSGDITSGVFYVIAFNQALNVGAGGFVIVSATPASLSLPVTVANGGTGLTSLTTFAPLCGGTGVIANVQQATTGFSTVGAVLTSQGAGALPTWVAAAASGGSLVSIQSFNSSQTLTIPATATKLYAYLIGGGGGAQNGGVGGGSGATCISLFTGFTPGNTLALTIGAGGTNVGGNGGNSTLASGSQTISTMTAGGGTGGTGIPPVFAAGGTATGGSLANITGSTGFGFGAACGNFGLGGASTLGGQALAIVALTTISPGLFPGGGGASGNASTGAVGAGGFFLAWWFT